VSDHSSRALADEYKQKLKQQIADWLMSDMDNIAVVTAFGEVTAEAGVALVDQGEALRLFAKIAYAITELSSDIGSRGENGSSRRADRLKRRRR